MVFFRLHSFEPERHLTIRVRGPWGPFAGLVVTYRIDSPSPTHCRLVVKLAWRSVHPVVLFLFALGDWIMMRKQLLTLRALAEATPRSAEGF